MAIFFASAFLVFAVTAVLQGDRRLRSSALGKILLVGLAVGAVLVAATADLGDAVARPALLGFFTGRTGTYAMAGALAGAALAWGVGRTPRRLPEGAGAQIGVALVSLVTPIAIFLGALFIANPASLGGLRSLEISGLKVEMGAGAGGRSPVLRETQPSVATFGGVQANFVGAGRLIGPQLEAMTDLTQGLNFDRDGDYIAALARRRRGTEAEGRLLAQRAAESAVQAWSQHRDLLRQMDPLVACIGQYVRHSQDRALIAVQFNPAVLELAVFERSFRHYDRLTAGPARPSAASAEPETRARLNAMLADLHGNLSTPLSTMRRYIVPSEAARPDTARLASVVSFGAASPTAVLHEAERAGVAAPCSVPAPFMLREAQQDSERVRIAPHPEAPQSSGRIRVAPHLAIFAAWAFSSVGSYELAGRTLGDWLNDFAKPRPETSNDRLSDEDDILMDWFRVKAFVELAQISYVHETTANESRFAMRVLDAALKEIADVEGFPTFDEFSAQRRPMCRTVPESERKLLTLRAQLALRMIHAVIDNDAGQGGGGGRQFEERDLLLARQLRALSVECLFRDPVFTETYYEASIRAAHARALFVRAVSGAEDRSMSASEAADQIQEALRDARAAVWLFRSAERQWNETIWQACERQGGCTLTSGLEREYEGLRDMRRANGILLEIQSNVRSQ